MLNKTKLQFNEEVRTSILSGVRKINDAVVTTLGPKGQNVLISSEYGAPAVVHDGVTVASYINLEDEQENQAALLIKQAAQQSNKETGDGTTTTVLLAAEITEQALQLVTAGMNGMSLRRGIQDAVRDVVSKLNDLAHPVSQEEWKDIATISAQDPEIGEIVAEAFEKVGRDGSIQVEQGAKGKVEIEHQQGMSFESGYVSPYFAIGEGEQMTVVYEEARLLISTRSVSSDSDLAAIAKIASTEQRPLIIIAESLSDRVLTTLLQNKFKNGLQVVAINPPEFGDRRTQVMEDIALVTGARLITKEMGLKVSDASVSDLGYVKKIVVDKDSTVLSFDPDSSKSLVEERVENLKKQLAKEDNEFNRVFIEKRIARLTGGIAVIFAGGKTDVESKELRARIDDAVGATRSAIEEGVIIGGGTAFYHISRELAKKDLSGDKEYIAGYEVVLKALEKPLEMLVKNSNQNPGMIMERINNTNEADHTLDWGFNAYTGQVDNLKIAKVLDPVKVVRVAIENAASAAGALITTACSVVQIVKES